MQEFVIRVQRGPLPDKSWRIYKRYNDFLKLHGQLQVSGIPLPLPPKKIIGNMDPDFIAERQKQLQVSIDENLMYRRFLTYLTQHENHNLLYEVV